MYALVRSDIVPLTFALLTLTGCGGGSDSAPPADERPAIQEYAADRPSYAVGERAKLTVRYAHGAGRIEPGIGAVANGATVETPPLDVTTRYELIVESSKGIARRELTLTVAYRDRYRRLAQPFPVAFHANVLAGDGSVIVIGGSRGGPAISASIDRFDPRTEEFAKIGELAGGPILGATATRLSDGRILIAGGAHLQAGAGGNQLIDERTGATSATGAMQARRLAHTAVALADDSVLVTGGYTDEGYGDASESAEIWNPKTGAFRRLADYMHVPRAYHTATLLDDGRVLIVGGFTFRTPYVLAEIFDPKTETFTVVPSNDTDTRGMHASLQLADGSVLIVGGEDVLATTYHRSALLWNRASGVLEVMPDLLFHRSLVRAVATRADQVLLFGGAIHEEPRATQSAETYNRGSGGTHLPALPAARVWHSVTRLADGRVLILGGEDDEGNLIGDALIFE